MSVLQDTHHYIGSQPLPGYTEPYVLIGDMRRKPKYADTQALMNVYGAKEICMYRTETHTNVCLLRHALPPKSCSQAHSSPVLFSERHPQPQREKTSLSFPSSDKTFSRFLLSSMHTHRGDKSTEKGRATQLRVAEVEEEVTKSEHGVSVQAASTRLR